MDILIKNLILQHYELEWSCVTNKQKLYPHQKGIFMIWLNIYLERKNSSKEDIEQIGYPLPMLWSETYHSHFPSVSASTRRNATCCLRARFSVSNGLDVLTHACQSSKYQQSFSNSFTLDSQKDTNTYSRIPKDVSKHAFLWWDSINCIDIKISSTYTDHDWIQLTVLT